MAWLPSSLPSRAIDATKTAPGLRRDSRRTYFQNGETLGRLVARAFEQAVREQSKGSGDVSAATFFPCRASARDRRSRPRARELVRNFTLAALLAKVTIGEFGNDPAPETDRARIA